MLYCRNSRNTDQDALKKEFLKLMVNQTEKLTNFK